VKTAFDPLQRLTTQESIRFVGTIGGVSTNVPEHFSNALELFVGREVRTAAELVQKIVDSSGCTTKVASVSVDEVAALGLIASVPGPTLQHRKFLLDDQGRVVNAMREHRDWKLPARRRQLFLRPMFEANGDYLLQAMAALERDHEPATPLDVFRDLVHKMAQAKVDQLPTGQSGSKWDAYRQSVIARKKSIFGEQGVTSDGSFTLEALQAQRRKASKQLLDSLRSNAKSSLGNDASRGAAVGESKTLEHHFARCRAWLESLGLAEQRQGRGTRLSAAGESLLQYFRQQLRGPVLSIPPSVDTLSDCFRLEASEAKEIWGVAIDDAFWENAILTLERAGSYTPRDTELKERFDRAFDAVRVTGIPEAMLSPLRQALFFGFLWDGKPVVDLGPSITGDTSIPARHPDQYGFGRNRQGRLAYLFRKSPDVK
jgi:hypothetical protein